MLTLFRFAKQLLQLSRLFALPIAHAHRILATASPNMCCAGAAHLVPSPLRVTSALWKLSDYCSESQAMGPYKIATLFTCCPHQTVEPLSRCAGFTCIRSIRFRFCSFCLLRRLEIRKEWFDEKLALRSMQPHIKLSHRRQAGTSTDSPQEVQNVDANSGFIVP